MKSKVSNFSRGQHDHQDQIYREMPGQLGSGARGGGGSATIHPGSWNALSHVGAGSPAYSAGYQPYAEVSGPLGGHLHPATKEMIWRGKFVDLFSLLFQAPDRLRGYE